MISRPSDEDPSDAPSKSELKRRSRDLQDLGDELAALAPADLDALGLPDDLREAIEVARRITSHGARLRQKLYIGKLLRRIDPGAIVSAMDRRHAVDRARLRDEKDIEAWRDRLLEGGEADWTAFATQYPHAGMPELRSLANQARAERMSRRPPAAARRLFRRLREILAAPAPD